MAEAADVVIQVLDARDPLACRCPEVERYIRSLDPNKKIILLINKIGASTGRAAVCPAAPDTKRACFCCLAAPTWRAIGRAPHALHAHTCCATRQVCASLFQCFC